MRAPTSPREDAPLFILLQDDPLDSFQDVDGWIVSLPSRPHMNYQLLAEGDFWNILKDIKALYPNLKTVATFLIGVGDSSDAALSLANNYRPLFNGVAFSGSRIGLDLPNLDTIPVIHFSSEVSILTTPWGGEVLIKRLQERGNIHASSTSGDMTEAMQLLTMRPSSTTIPRFSFTDYQYSQILPWLQVAGKISEWDPVEISGEIREGVLTLNATNVSSLNITLSESITFPHKIKKIRLNHEVFSIPSDVHASFLLTKEEQTYHQNSKYRTPGTMVDFFRNEPLYLVYQDQDTHSEYLQKTLAIATRFSQLDFSGLPPLKAKIPLIPLSQYNANALPPHRIIAIGQPQKIERVLSNDSDYLPLHHSSSRMHIFGKTLPSEGHTERVIAYGLIFPPQAPSSQKLSLLLAADDLEGLSLLESHYCSAITLHDPQDLKVWVKEDTSYKFLTEEIFSTYWQENTRSALLIEVPLKKSNLWESYLHELLIEESQLATFALTKSLGNLAQIPSRLTYQALSDFIPNKHYAIVKLHGLGADKLGTKLLAAMDDLTLSGLDDWVYINKNTKKTSFLAERFRQKESLSVLIDAAALEELSAEELRYLDYDLLPYSLREMFFHRITKEKERFAKAFLRIASTEAESQQNNRSTFERVQ
uniref:Uncharacterized protein n=1 Tax=uncultured bacterium W5-77b TaxID=1131000 RepID=H9BWG4_9BACT|nr:hypothetical protein [uncultured bacterium W5-77b]